LRWNDAFLFLCSIAKQQACQGIRVLTDSKLLIQRLAQSPAQQTDTICSSIWTVLATIGLSNLVSVHWMPGHVGLEGNAEADLEAKRGIALSQSSTLFLPVWPSSGINRVSLSTGIAATLMPESIGCLPAVSASSSAGNVIGQYVTLAQLRTDRSPLLAGYLHRIGRRDSATCPHCNGADETAEHLVLQYPAHDQARRDIWPGGKFNTDPRCLWVLLEWIGVVFRPPHSPDREWGRERAC